MRTNVKGKNVEVTDHLRDYAERKLGRFARLTDDQTEATVELSHEHHRSADLSHIVEVGVVLGGQPIHSHAAGPTFESALDDVADKVERQIVDHKERPRLRARPNEEKQLLSRLADGTAETGTERRIVKTKRFAIEPMFEEDAIAAMEELGHRFYVFVNAENERVAVIYVRDDGHYGMIEPSIGGDYTTGRARAAAGRRQG
jgi:putative sigma-54 modulation protein